MILQTSVRSSGHDQNEPMRECAVDPSTFRDALSLRAHGVGVITLRDRKNLPRGMTATAICPVSAEGLLVLACIDRSTHTHALIQENGRAGINMLAADQAAISRYCSSDGHNKHLPDLLLEGAVDTVTPVIRGALVYLDCRVRNVYPAGSHSIILLAVERIFKGPTALPLVYFGRTYSTIQPLLHRQDLKAIGHAQR